MLGPPKSPKDWMNVSNHISCMVAQTQWIALGRLLGRHEGWGYEHVLFAKAWHEGS